MKEVEILMENLKQQHSWRLEDAECGGDEVADSWEMLKIEIAEDIKQRHPNYNFQAIEIILAS